MYFLGTVNVIDFVFFLSCVYKDTVVKKQHFINPLVLDSGHQSARDATLNQAHREGLCGPNMPRLSGLPTSRLYVCFLGSSAGSK